MTDYHERSVRALARSADYEYPAQRGGLALLGNVVPTVVAGVIALSLLGVVANLALAAALTGRFVDVLVRDLGLAALAVGVTLRAARDAHR